MGNQGNSVTASGLGEMIGTELEIKERFYVLGEYRGDGKGFSYQGHSI